MAITIELNELAGLLAATSAAAPANDASAYEIGKNYLIRTVTMIQTGRLVAVTQQELVLEEVSWIADTGRFSDALATCDFHEVEPFLSGRRVVVGRGALIDAVQIDTLPRIQK